MDCCALANGTGAKSMATSRLTANRRGKDESFTFSSLYVDDSRAAATTELVEQHGADDDRALDDWLVVRRNIHEHEPIREHADQQRSRQRAKNGTAPSRKTGAADHDRGDSVQLVALAGVRLTGVEP